MIKKILVTGHFSAGKTEFIKTLTQNHLSTDVKLTHQQEKETKSRTTVAMDYGKIHIRNSKIHLFGTPGQERFDFMIELLSRDYHGAIVILDSSNEKYIENSQKFINLMRKNGRPFIIACNKQDLDRSINVEKISEMISIPKNILVPLVAKDRNSCLNVLHTILEFLEKGEVAA